MTTLLCHLTTTLLQLRLRQPVDKIVLHNAATDWTAYAWDVQIEGRLYLMKLYDKLTTGATGDEKKAIYGPGDDYGLIASG